MADIDITGLNKAELVARLYNAAPDLAPGSAAVVNPRYYPGSTLSWEVAAQIIRDHAAGNRSNVDILGKHDEIVIPRETRIIDRIGDGSKKIGVKFNGDTLVNNGMYNSYNGAGKLEAIVSEMHHEAKLNRLLAAPKISQTEINVLRGGAVAVTGIATAVGMAAFQAPEGQKKQAANIAVKEVVAPGSSKDGNDFCKNLGTYTGVGLGTVAGGFAGTGAGVLASPFVTPAGGTVVGVLAGGGAYSVTYSAVKPGTEDLCNAVKGAADKAVATLNSALTFGGSDLAPQNPHKQVVADNSVTKK